MAGEEVRATYRIQLHAGFTFDDLASLTPYLAELGISHVYCSPYLQAACGSTHGYDVTDHSRISDEIGGVAGFERFCKALAATGMRHIVDIVPNHMAIADRSNRWWWDVLKHGPSSKYASYFDIDWDPPETRWRRTILVPILSDHYGRVLDAGDLRLAQEGDEIVVRYHEHAFPIDPASVHENAAIESINAEPDLLHDLLERQHYRLAFWKLGDRELNYRRFFDVKTLAGLRVERPEVFDDVHRLVFRLVDEGKLDGLRIDHIDGLHNPTEYLERLRDRVGASYVVVEKILEGGEQLPEQWPVEGTTGYDFLNFVNGLFVDPTGEKPMNDAYETFIGRRADLAEVVRGNKLYVMKEILAADVERLTALFADICETHRRYRDYTRHELREALRETIAAFAVYRTYVDPRDGTASDQDVAYVEEAIQEASGRRPDLDPELFSFIEQLLLMRVPGVREKGLATRFQQTTGSVMAKGVEDTAFYNYNRLVSLNEVGSDLGCWSTSIEEFHEGAAAALRRRPRSLLATSTHDTKRSEDVRARIDLLSEIPAHWAQAARGWRLHNERHRSDGMPDRNDEYLLYQTLVGAWPLEVDRAVAYMEKASKEAKAQTSWVDPSPDYDAALASFVRDVLGDREFVSDLEAFVEPLVVPGRINSLAQTLIKLTYPGLPDTYQGTELWDSSLVDPDNRRPVDYEQRATLLDEMKRASAQEVWGDRAQAAAKLFLVYRALRVRKQSPDVFGPAGSYDPLRADGRRADHVVAFVRGDRAATIAPRLVLALAGDWSDTSITLPSGEWVDELSDSVWRGRVPLGGLFARFPVALLVRS